ncbi:MAG: glycosyltransferase family 2 protein [Prolixibacteraceae bacterium]|nr:glycosyltransferase family 2 protein [Prolixibacteraceae bacterium]
MKVIFYILLGLTLYTYIIYPVILFIIVKAYGFLKKNNMDNSTDLIHENTVSVAMICAMFNEEKVAEDKIRNFFDLSYKNKKLYIGSDGSNDRTNEILKKYLNDKRIKIFFFPRRGKVFVINDLIENATEDVIIFTDANSMYQKDSIEKLLDCFRDTNIGAVCGRLKLVQKGGTSGEGFYWRYETWIKKQESLLGAVMGGNGAIYAVRRELLSPINTNTINDDFVISMKVIEKGYGMVYAEDAVAAEEVGDSDSVEFKRHIRDGAGHYRAMITLFRLLNPMHPKIFFLYVSHRIIRWLVPFFFVPLLMLPLFIENDSVTIGLFFIQVVIYIFAIIGFMLRNKVKIKIFYIPFYFIMINIALLIGFFKVMLGFQKVTWDSTVR